MPKTWTRRKTAFQRFCAKIVFQDSGCWEWTGAGSKVRLGYGNFWDGDTKRQLGPHRYSYERFVGQIPDGLHLDHLCRNPKCVNPGHLEPVTCQVNVLRGISVFAKNAKKTHCPKGHPLFLRRNGKRTSGRRCRECERIRERAREQRPGYRERRRELGRLNTQRKREAASAGQP